MPVSQFDKAVECRTKLKRRVEISDELVVGTGRDFGLSLRERKAAVGYDHEHRSVSLER